MEIAAPGPPPRRIPIPDRVGLVGLAGILLTSLLVCLSATQSELLLPTSLRPLPGPLAGAGLKLGVYALIAAFVTMSPLRAGGPRRRVAAGAHGADRDPRPARDRPPRPASLLL